MDAADIRLRDLYKTEPLDGLSRQWSSGYVDNPGVRDALGTR